MAETGETVRWAVYQEILATKLGRSDQDEMLSLVSAQRRVTELLDWPANRDCPRWRLIECWTIAAHGPQMATAGGFRLAFWSEPAEHHGPRLKRALARYQRFAKVRPPGFPAGAIAALAYFLSRHVARQDGPEHGMAYDIARFTELTKQMSAYAHYQRTGHLELAARRARRRQQLDELAEQLNQRLRFRRDNDTGAQLRRARQLLDSDQSTHRHAGRALHAAVRRQELQHERDQHLLAGQHPGDTDGRYQAAYRYAQQWGLPAPPAGRENLPGSRAAGASATSTENRWVSRLAPAS